MRHSRLSLVNVDVGARMTTFGRVETMSVWSRDVMFNHRVDGEFRGTSSSSVSPVPVEVRNWRQSGLSITRVTVPGILSRAPSDHVLDRSEAGRRHRDHQRIPSATAGGLVSHPPRSRVRRRQRLNCCRRHEAAKLLHALALELFSSILSVFWYQTE